MINPSRIEEILQDCLMTEEEAIKLGVEEDTDWDDDMLPDCVVIGAGVLASIALMKTRLDGHAEEIKGMLAELKDRFHEDGGSFLEMCRDKDGSQWGEHQSCDLLFILGNALGLARFLGPRAMWPMLPGGMPYLKIDGVR